MFSCCATLSCARLCCCMLHHAVPTKVLHPRSAALGCSALHCSPLLLCRTVLRGTLMYCIVAQGCQAPRQPWRRRLGLRYPHAAAIGPRSCSLRLGSMATYSQAVPAFGVSQHHAPCMLAPVLLVITAQLLYQQTVSLAPLQSENHSLRKGPRCSLHPS